MTTLDEIRSQAERDLQGLLADLDAQHRELLRDALRQYERVQDIPENIWNAIKQNIEESATFALLALMIAADGWTTQEIDRQGVARKALTPEQLAGYSLDAARRARAMADTTTETLRDRLKRKVEDMRTSGPGDVGDLNDDGIEQALDETLTKERQAGIATDETTQGISRGQKVARDRRIGGDGAATNDQGQSVGVVLYWAAELDNRTCPRCRPLDGQPEEVWSRVFPNGPGPEAHPNCRCSLRPVVIVTRQDQSA